MSLFRRSSLRNNISSRRNVWFSSHSAPKKESPFDSKEAMKQIISHEVWVFVFWTTVVSALKLKLPHQYSVNTPLQRSTSTQQSYRVLGIYDEALSKQTDSNGSRLLKSLTKDKAKPGPSSSETLPWFVAAAEGKEFKSLEKSFSSRHKDTIPISNPHELRRKILDENIPLKDVTVQIDDTPCKPEDLISHEVVALIVRRFNEQSTPGHRPADDKSILALSLEGGGMRGAVTAGMAAAIASLGLTDCFDRIYGSSAGSVIGAYMVR